MYRLCVFAGTIEGRRIVEFLAAQPASVTACVAPEYGKALIEPAENVTVLSGRLSAGEIARLLRENAFDLVIDAAHPRAGAVTRDIRQACEETGTAYLRLTRKGPEAPDEAVYVPDAQAAVEFLSAAEGNILLTTGCRDLAAFAALEGFQERVYARVSPTADSIEACREAGLKPDHILAIQGPFTEEMNRATARFVSARWIVTTDSGGPDGFDAKIAAARKTGARLIVIGPPPQTDADGLSLPEAIERLRERFGFVHRPHVSLVGVGPGGGEWMTAAARRAIDRADCLIGAKRILDSAAAPSKKRVEAVLPEEIAGFIRARGEFRRIAVLLSGDTGFFSGVKRLLPALADCEVEVLPGVSSLSYLCARLKTSYEDVVPVSLHGRDEDILRAVRDNPRVFVLSGGNGAMARLCRVLTDAGLGHVKMHIGERLSYPEENITSGTAAELTSREFDEMSAALIENDRAGVPVPHGLPAEAFARERGRPTVKSKARAGQPRPVHTA